MTIHTSWPHISNLAKNAHFAAFFLLKAVSPPSLLKSILPLERILFPLWKWNSLVKKKASRIAGV